MISISKYTTCFEDNLTVITGTEDFVCPICGCNDYEIHGTCHRKVRSTEGIKLFRLRVLRCSHCGKTHRELPAGIVPYKRLCAESLVGIAEADPFAQAATLNDEDFVDYETSTWRRIRKWLRWFLQYAQFVAESLRTGGLQIPAELPGKALSEQLIYFVRLVVNSGNWLQHRSALSSH